MAQKAIFDTSELLIQEPMVVSERNIIIVNCPGKLQRLVFLRPVVSLCIFCI